MIKTIAELQKFSEEMAKKYPSQREYYLLSRYEVKPTHEINLLKSTLMGLPESYVSFISEYNVLSMEYLGFQFAPFPCGHKSVYSAVIEANSEEYCAYYEVFKEKGVFDVASYDGAWIVVAGEQSNSPGTIYIKHDTGYDDDLLLFAPDFDTFILLVANLDKLANYETE
jgi:hypothetical protein